MRLLVDEAGVDMVEALGDSEAMLVVVVVMLLLRLLLLGLLLLLLLLLLLPLLRLPSVPTERTRNKQGAKRHRAFADQITARAHYLLVFFFTAETHVCTGKGKGKGRTVVPWAMLRRAWWLGADGRRRGACCTQISRSRRLPPGEGGLSKQGRLVASTALAKTKCGGCRGPCVGSRA